MAEGGEAHWEVLERILFLYAKLNPGQGYVQGMNEIVGPIYHAFACDPDPTWRSVYYNMRTPTEQHLLMVTNIFRFTEYAEADTFFCFTNLMAEIRDFFIKTLDEAEFGINSMMSKLTNQVRANDPDVWLRLHQQELCPQYYSFRYRILMIIINILSRFSFLFCYSPVWNKMVDTSSFARVSPARCYEDMGFLIC